MINVKEYAKQLINNRKEKINNLEKYKNAIVEKVNNVDQDKLEHVIDNLLLDIISNSYETNEYDYKMTATNFNSIRMDLDLYTSTDLIASVFSLTKPLPDIRKYEDQYAELDDNTNTPSVEIVINDALTSKIIKYIDSIDNLSAKPDPIDYLIITIDKNVFKHGDK